MPQFSIIVGGVSPPMKREQLRRRLRKSDIDDLEALGKERNLDRTTMVSFALSSFEHSSVPFYQGGKTVKPIDNFESRAIEIVQRAATRPAQRRSNSTPAQREDPAGAAELLLAVLDDALNGSRKPTRGNTLVSPLYLSDPVYLRELDGLAHELRQLISQLKRTPKPSAKEAGPFAKALKTFLENYAATLGKGAAYLTIGAAIAILDRLNGGHALALEMVQTGKGLG